MYTCFPSVRLQNEGQRRMTKLCKNYWNVRIIAKFQAIVPEAVEAEALIGYCTHRITAKAQTQTSWLDGAHVMFRRRPEEPESQQITVTKTALSTKLIKIIPPALRQFSTWEFHSNRGLLLMIKRHRNNYESGCCIDGRSAEKCVILRSHLAVKWIVASEVWLT